LGFAPEFAAPDDEKAPALAKSHRGPIRETPLGKRSAGPCSDEARLTSCDVYLVCFWEEMLSRYRRFLALPAALLLAAPLLLTSPKANLSPDELRVLSAAPPFPQTMIDAINLPKQIDAWLQD